jgi:hypothetical protein
VCERERKRERKRERESERHRFIGAVQSFDKALKRALKRA